MLIPLRALLIWVVGDDDGGLYRANGIGILRFSAWVRRTECRADCFDDDVTGDFAEIPAAVAGINDGGAMVDVNASGDGGRSSP